MFERFSGRRGSPVNNLIYKCVEEEEEDDVEICRCSVSAVHEVATDWTILRKVFQPFHLSTSPSLHRGGRSQLKVSNIRSESCDYEAGLRSQIMAVEYLLSLLDLGYG